MITRVNYIRETYGEWVRFRIDELGISSDDLIEKPDLFVHTTIEDQDEEDTETLIINNISAGLGVDQIPDEQGGPPKIFLQLKAILDNDTVDMEEISSVILKDPGLVAKLLQVTNSAFFAQTKAVETLKEAITRVGTDLVIGTILAIELYENLQNIPVDFIEIQQSHSLSTAKLASSFVEQEYRISTQAVIIPATFNVFWNDQIRQFNFKELFTSYNGNDNE